MKNGFECHVQCMGSCEHRWVSLQWGEQKQRNAIESGSGLMRYALGSSPKPISARPSLPRPVPFLIPNTVPSVGVFNPKYMVTHTHDDLVFVPISMAQLNLAR